ncbi:hypothetical protein [Sciscionella marina]|uniref:hypothetical protein n=1 Tax=Sciscionella marina TaxID=508770 RepID=UPI00036E3254|nr:hypothetical protein [Sciscionella marina]
MGFEVNTTALQLYTNLLKQAHETAGSIDKYVATNLNGPAAGSASGLFGEIDPKAEQTSAQVRDAGQRMSSLLEDCSDAMRQTTTMYERTEREQAAKLDATYPSAPAPPQRGMPWLQGSNQAGPIMAKEDAAGKLKPPGEPQDFEDPFEVINTISGYLSPGTMIQKGLDLAFGFNPAAEATKALVGDGNRSRR